MWRFQSLFALVSVKQWLLVPIQCQQRSPFWGVVKEETLFSAEQLSCDTAPMWEQDSCGTTQLWYNMTVKTAQLWGSPRARPLLWLDSSLLLLLVLLFFALLFCAVLVFSVCSSETSLVLQLSQGDAVFRFPWKGKCALRARGGLAYRNRRPCPWSLTDLSSSKWGLKILCDWSKQYYPNWLKLSFPDCLELCGCLKLCSYD